MSHIMKDVFTDLDIARTNERSLALEVARVDGAQFSSVEDELGEVDFAAVDGVQKGRAAGGQTLAVVRVVHLKLGLHCQRNCRLTVAASSTQVGHV